MGRKVFNHFADVACHMFMGWRLFDDLEPLAALGAGTLELDLMSGNCLFNETPVPRLHIAQEIAQWLSDALERHRIPSGALQAADLTVVFTSARKDDEVTFVFECEACIDSGDRKYARRVRETHRWVRAERRP
jgi:hypothetical protein